MVNITDVAFSPTPTKQKKHEQGTMNFGNALQQTLKGKKITRIEWNDKEFYGVLKNARLMLHKPDGKLHYWIINEGDIIGTDWIIV